MLFMNEHDIDRAENLFHGDPVLGPAVRTLRNLVSWTNSNSDGWAYWPKPCRAAEKLQRLIQSGSATADELRTALRPVKAFRTRQMNVGLPSFEIVEP